jgi:hypothetical protein
MTDEQHLNVKNKKILVVTFSRNCNLGGALQEYALFATLKNHGSVKCLDYLSESIAILSKPIRGGFIKKLKMMGASSFRLLFQGKNVEQNEQHHYSLLLTKPRLLVAQVVDRFYIMLSDIIHYGQRKKMLSNFFSFHEKYVQYTERFNNEQLMDKDICDALFQDYDICIAGSDQIWNPSYAGASPCYFLGFVPEGISKASYASSFGNYKFTNEKLNDRISAYLSDFVCIGVREYYSVAHLKDKCNIHAECVLDPTLLLSKDEWKNRLGIKPSGRQPFLLVYALGDRRVLLPLAKKVGHYLNLNIIVIDKKFMFDFTNSGIDYLPATGPREFIELFSEAAFVITNSFHGTAFSVNFNIPFFTVVSQVNERAQAFLDMVQLGERLISDSRNCDLGLTKMDFAHANQILEQERKRSINYLENIVHNVGKESGGQ